MATLAGVTAPNPMRPNPEPSLLTPPYRWARYGTVGLLAGSSLALLFSLLAPFSVVADSVAHFRLYFLVALCATLVSSLVLKQRKMAVVNLMAMLVAITSLAGVLRNPPQKDLASNFLLLQLNVYYNNQTPDALVAYVRRQQPDVLTLQEVFPAQQGVIDSLRADYPHVASCGVDGTVVMSRLPPWPQGEQGCTHFNGQAGVAYLTVERNGRPVTLMSLHLVWPYPSRQKQHVDAVTTELARFGHPLIVAGDFNATPWSHTVKRIEEASRTHIVGGVRHSWFSRRFRLGLPIDHVLLPDSVHAQGIEIGQNVGSDHRPVLIRLAL